LTREEVYLLGVKRAFLVMVCAAAVVLGTSCTTLENRADLYSPRNYFANGPYTRMLRSGIPKVTTVFVQTTVTRTTEQTFSPHYGK
jgi:hypothetical protein